MSTTKGKTKTPAIVLLAIDSIRKGIAPSEETLDAIWDEIDGNNATLKIAKALLAGASSTDAAIQPSREPVQRVSQQEVPLPSQGRSKPLVQDNTVPLTPVSLGGLKGKASILSRKK